MTYEERKEADVARATIKLAHAKQAENDNHLLVRLDTEIWHCRNCPAQWNDALYTPKNKEATQPCLNAPHVAPTLVYVLTREHSDLSGYEVLRVFHDERRANQDLDLVKGDHGMIYRVHRGILMVSDDD